MKNLNFKSNLSGMKDGVVCTVYGVQGTENGVENGKTGKREGRDGVVSWVNQPTNHPLITHLSPTGIGYLPRIWRYAAALVLALILGCGEMWGTDRQHYVGVALSNPNNYTVKLNVNRSGWGWYTYGTYKAGLTYEGKKVYIANYQTNADDNYIYDFQWQLYDGDTQKYSKNILNNTKSENYYDYYIYNYDGDAWYTAQVMNDSRTYFDATGWSGTDIRLVITHSQLQKYHTMYTVSGTKLWYTNDLSFWDNAMGVGVVSGGSSSRKGDQTAYYEYLTDISSKATEFTGLKHYSFNNNDADKCYLIVNNGKAGEAPDITYEGTNYLTLLNKTQTYNTVVKVGAGSYTSANSKATISISSYELTSQGGTTNRTPSISTSASSTTVSACRTATTRLQVGTVDGDYQFDGWYTAATGGSLVSNSTDYTYYPTSANTYYARFSQKAYTLTYYANGGTDSAPAAETIYSGNTVTVKDNTTLMTKSGKVFAGWATTAARANDGTIDYAPGATFTAAGNVDLYAVWTDGYYLISLAGAGNTGTKDGANFIAKQKLQNAQYAVNGVTFSMNSYKFVNNQTSISGASNQDTAKFIIYDTEKTQTTVRVYLYNKEGSANRLYYNVIKEGVSASSDSYVDVPASSGYLLNIDASSTKRARVVLSTGDCGNLFVTQIIAIEKGSSLPGVGEAGYELTFPGRPYTYSKKGSIDKHKISYEPYENYALGASSSDGMKFQSSGYIEFITPSATQLKVTTKSGKGFYVCTNKSNPGTTGFLTTASGSTYNIYLDAGGKYYIVGETSSNTYIKKVAFAAHSACTAPTKLEVGTITYNGATFTVTDGTNANNYEFYVSTSSTAPTASTTPTYTSTSKTLAVDDLNKNTTYYAWVRTNGGYFHKSSWTALTGTSFKTLNAYDITYNCDGAESGCPATGSGVTLPNPLPDAPFKPGYNFDGWFTNSGKTTPAVAGAAIAANTTLYAKWTKVYATTNDFTTSATQGTVPNQKTITTSYEEYAPFRVDNFFFGATNKLCFESGNGDTKYNGWKFQYSGSIIKFFVENDCSVAVAMGANAGCNITYTPIDGSQTTEALSTTANTTTTKDVKGGTMVTLTTTSGSTVTLKSITITDKAACTTPTIAWSTSPANGNVGGNMTISVTSNYPAGVSITSNNSNATLTGRTVAGSTVSYTLNYAVAGNANITASVDGDGSTVCDETVNLDAVAITISKKTPTSYTVSGTAAICSGSYTNVTLSNSQTGISYQLYKDGVASGESQAGSTGNALNWSVSTAGTYTVKTVENATYAEATMSGSAVVTIKSAATITWGTQPANGTVGDADFAYAVSCSDGSTVTVTSNNTSVATIVGGKLHYVAAGTTYLIANATDACGNVLTPVNSNNFTVSAAACTSPLTPDDLSIDSKTSNSITFSWYGPGLPAGTVDYEVYVEKKDDGTQVQNWTSTVASNSYTVTGLDPSTEYTLKVRALGDTENNYCEYSGVATIDGTTNAASALITWTMNVTTDAAWGTSTAPTTSEPTHISSIGTSHDEGSNTAKSSATPKTKMASAEVTDSSTPDYSARFTFTVASGKKVVPSKVTCKVFNVSSGNRTYKAQISDNNGHVYNSTSTVAVSTEATLTDAEFTFAAGGVLTGNVTIRVYAWKTSSSPTEFRMGPEIKLFGTVENYEDETPPTLVSSVPANSATGVAVSGNIVLTFSENVTINDASKFTLSGGVGSLTTASISASGAVVTIPYTGLANNTTYTLATAANAVKDGSNNMNAALSNISFTTEISDGCAAPGSGSSVYKFETKSSGLGTGNVCAAANTDYDLTTSDALTTLTGGTLKARTSNTSHLKYATSAISYANGSGGILKIHMDCALKTGDVIRYISYSSNNNKYNYLRHTSNSTTSGQLTLAASTTANTMQTVVVTSDFNGKDDVFIVSGSNPTAISYFEVIRPYTVTLDANTNGGKIDGENTKDVYALSTEHITLPRPTKDGVRFKGWFDASSGGTQASMDYVPTGSIRLYAQWEDCPASGTVYKWQLKSGLTNGDVTEGDVNTINYLSTLIGGTVTAHQNSSKLTVVSNSKFQFADNNVYLKMDLDCPLRTGDKFKTTIETDNFCITSSASRSTTNSLTTGSLHETDVPEGLVGATTLYIWRYGNNSKISYFEVVRSSATFDLTYDGNDQTSAAGTVPSAVTDQTYDAAITLASVGSMAKTNYTFGGWNTEDDGTGTNYAGGATFTIKDNTTLYAKWTQVVTLDGATNGGSDGSATAVWNATGLTSFVAATPPSGNKCTGYFDAAEGGNKILNADGTYASANVTNYVTSGKWSRTGAAPTLYAQYESSGSLTWNLGVNTDASSLTTSSKSSAFTEISNANMTNAALTGLTYIASKKSNLTGKISTPATYDAGKYVSVTFQIAAGYKFIPSSVKVLVQPVGNGEDKDVKLSLTDDSSHSLVSASATQCQGTSSGKTTTVTLAGDGSTYFTGTVTLKIYAYNHSGSSTSNDCYRLGTPITIEGAVEATCTMPSFSGLSYEDTEYTKDAAASAITVTNPEDVTTYAWKQNTTNDRTGTKPASGTNNTASYTPPTNTAGTMYYWCELTNACGTVKTASVAITVSESKSDASVTWSNPGTVNYGGGGYTIRATVSAGWDGNAADLDVSAPAGIRIYNVTSGTDGSSRKYVEINFDVQTAYDRTDHPSNIPFVVSADATTGYNAISAENDVAYSACTGGGAASESYLPVDVAHIDDETTVKGGWLYSGTGWIRYAHGSSSLSSSNVKSLAHSMGTGNVITKYYGSSSNHFGFYTESAIDGVRLYVYTTNTKVTVSGVYVGNAAYNTGTPSTGAVTYETTYYNDDDGLLAATNGGCTWVEILFDNEVAAGKYGQINLSGNLYIAGMAFLSTSGGGASLTTTLTFATTGTVNKNQGDASFTNAASLTGSNTNSLGAITYSSSNPSCATVNATTGEVTITATGASALSTTITATLAASGCYKSATTTYTLNVAGSSCTDVAGTVTTEDLGCDGIQLTLSGYTAGASIKWYKDGAVITGQTGTTYTATESGSYYAVTTKGCDRASNTVVIADKTVSAERIVEQWYIKNGRLTPDIALWSVGEGTSLSSVAWSPTNETGLTASDFYQQDGVIYLKGKEPSSNETGADIPYTLTLTVSNGCNTTAMSDASKQVTLIHQKNTDKHVLAFVVTGTEKGGFTAGITAAQTTNVELYNTIAANFDVLATNIYSTDDEQKLKEYYSQFDILCITDYPNTGTKGVNKKSYVDAIGALIDIRPILTMEAFVSKLANWKAKGISGQPKSPCPRQYSMDLQCKDHEIFSGTTLTKIGEGDETMYRVTMVDKTKADYTTYDAETECTKAYKAGDYPALQGFTFDATMVADGLLPIGLIHNGESEELQVGIERQTEMEARLMVLGIQQKAMERLTKDGQTVVINALKYLMKKNAEDISDCSNYFLGGAEGHEDDWSYVENWSGATLPDKTQEVRIMAPCVIYSGTRAHVSSMKIVPRGKYNHGADDASGSLTIAAGGVLIVNGRVQSATAPDYYETRATSASDLVINTNVSGNGVLAVGMHDGTNEAIVNFYTKAYKDATHGWINQFIGSPFNGSDNFSNYYGSYLYKYDPTQDGQSGSHWVNQKRGSTSVPFAGYNLLRKDAAATTLDMRGVLVASENQELELVYGSSNTENVLANSWMAPIDIASMGDAFTGCEATVYIYNAGSKSQQASGDPTSGSGADKTSAGQYIALPVGSAPWTNPTVTVIPSMQAFSVIATADNARVSLDYKAMVLDPAIDVAVGELGTLTAATRIQRRAKTGVKPEILKLFVTGESGSRDIVYLLMRDDWTTDFENGFDGRKMNGDSSNPQLYAKSEAGDMTVDCIAEADGTVIGLKPGDDTNYTFTFSYDGEQPLYLNDLKTQQSTLIDAENVYAFSVEDGDDAERFIISATPFGAPEVATGTVSGERLEVNGAQKIIFNEKMYILYNGRVFDGTGKVVK